MRPIDADALVEYLYQLSEEYNENYDRLEDDDFGKSIMYGKFTTIVETILHIKRKMPTLDVKPVKHGFWVLQDDTYTNRMCSVCESPNHDGWESYCPNCGAKMDARMDGEE